ncbi:Hypothetical protein F387_01521 [Wohlfahrtiimonas chitiniclastica SH04]|uniref:Uncharacterized protein n=1 Tax=Wohlfahrtiimonas chitiniclastica SH04 TaxID=1261130 RepID=L8XY80_9GAMM|nr:MULTISPECIES: hypothetical protein [Wohlfahrtiimonas]ELV07715.1 Hypothetical protein F387_01521 [Wohlfahrtiimonas chitiniclastica SH04]OYQ72594.1 hypothetical protein B9T20_09630 [Wohlfahrtiimonas sp. G9077]
MPIQNLNKSQDQARRNTTEDMIEALQDIYTSQIIEFITDARRDNIRAWLNEGDTFHGNEWLLDSVITAMSNDVNLCLVAKSEHIPIGTFLTAKENCLYQLQEMKLDLITLLSLKHAVNEQIINMTKEMISITNSIKNYDQSGGI